LAVESAAPVEERIRRVEWRLAFSRLSSLRGTRHRRSRSPSSTFDQPLDPSRAEEAATAHKDGAPVKGRFHTYPEMAAAGSWTTPTDLALLAVELQNSLAGKSNKIISQEMAAQMLSRQFGKWGLGPAVEVRGEVIEFSHGGVDEGFEAQWTAFSDGRGVVVMTNGDRGVSLAMEIIRSVAREYGWSEHVPGRARDSQRRSRNLQTVRGPLRVKDQPATDHHPHRLYGGRKTLRPVGRRHEARLASGVRDGILFGHIRQHAGLRERRRRRRQRTHAQAGRRELHG
jgi:hypothetical protein